MKIGKEQYDNISIPEGLEQRLSDSIDIWANCESKRRSNKVMMLASACIIGVIAVLAGVMVFDSFESVRQQPEAIADTCTSPEEAAKAMAFAFDMLQQSLDKSFTELEEINDNYGDIKNAVITL